MLLADKKQIVKEQPSGTKIEVPPWDLVCPQLEYASTLWDPATKSSIMALNYKDTKVYYKISGAYHKVNEAKIYVEVIYG